MSTRLCTFWDEFNTLGQCKCWLNKPTRIVTSAELHLVNAHGKHWVFWKCLLHKYFDKKKIQHKQETLHRNEWFFIYAQLQTILAEAKPGSYYNLSIPNNRGKLWGNMQICTNLEVNEESICHTVTQRLHHIHYSNTYYMLVEMVLSSRMAYAIWPVKAA